MHNLILVLSSSSQDRDQATLGEEKGTTFLSFLYLLFVLLLILFLFRIFSSCQPFEPIPFLDYEPHYKPYDLLFP